MSASGHIEGISCKTCIYSWDRGPMLQCARHAPRPIAYTGDGPVPDNLGQSWVFPTVFDNHRCGEWKDMRWDVWGCGQ